MSWARLLLACVTVLVFSLLVKLGFWQLDRAAEKQHLQQALAARQQLAPLPFHQLINSNPDDSLTGYRLSVIAYPNSSQIVLLDNQVYQGIVGYLAFQAVAVNPHQPWLLVELGFIAAGPDRRVLPNITGLTNVQTLSGRLYQKSTNPLSEHLLAENGKPMRIQNLNLGELAQQLQHPLVPAILQPISMVESQLNALPRPWKPLPMGAEKHQGYAVQWFSLAGAFLLLILYLLLKEKITTQ